MSEHKPQKEHETPFSSSEKVASDENKSKKMDTLYERKKECLGSIGIELGNTYFRSAFSFQHDPFNMLRPAEQTYLSMQISTSILISPEGENCVSFGFKADEVYRDIRDDTEPRHYFFKNVLQELFKQSAISKSTMLGDIHNKQLQSHKILQMVTKYIISSTLFVFKERLLGVQMNDFSWTVTVPSPWNESFVSLLKECAQKEGLDQNLFHVIPQSVAISFCIKHHRHGVTRNNTRPGNIILIVNVDETVGICFQEVGPGKDVTLKELETPYGDIRCDSHISANLDKVMTDICGHKPWTSFKQLSFYEYDEIVQSIRHKLERNLETFVLHLNFDYFSLDNIKDNIKKSKLSKGLEIIAHTIRIGQEITKPMFYDTICNTISDVFRNLNTNKDFKKTESVILTGRFANINAIQDAVKTEFPDAKIIVPIQQDICALQGAVLRGYLSTLESKTGITQATYAVPLVVGAIDFGTTFSGWAMSFRHEFENNPADIVAKDWNSGENISNKAPTTVLIEPDGKTLAAFGYEAENLYADLLANDNHGDYFFFQRFKMLLYDNKTLTRETELQAVNGKSLKAMVIFKLAIQYLKDNLIAESQFKVENGINASEIHWTLTVPAIWNEKAKKFMREAAIQAGIDCRYLTLTLEPEAASLFVHHLAIGRNVDGKMEKLDPGTQYILVDCGGGTVDICCHEIQADGGLTEIVKARGNSIGGIRVDEAFEDMLIEVFGHDKWKEFKQYNMEDYLQLQRTFEIRKRNISPENEALITITLYPSLVGNLSLPLIVCSGSVRLLKQNKMRIEAKFARDRFFGNVLVELKELLMSITNSQIVSNVKTIVLVGGFGESDMVRMCIKENFPGYNLIAPKLSSLAIVKGAVIFGHDRSIITERIARYTYGTGKLVPFDEHQHQGIKCHALGVKTFVQEFRILVKEDAKLSSTFEIDDGTVVPMSNGQTEMRFPLFAVNGDTVPKYIDGGNCIDLGELVVSITDTNTPKNENEFSIKYDFGGTEIGAVITELKTGKQTTGCFQFLG